MAVKNWEMSRYTKEELDQLTLFFLNKMKEDYALFTHIKINGSEVEVRYMDVTKIIYNSVDSHEINTCMTPLIKLYEVLYRVPFKELPLFINDFPEIAAWRLGIGK